MMTVPDCENCISYAMCKSMYNQDIRSAGIFMRRLSEKCSIVKETTMSGSQIVSMNNFILVLNIFSNDRVVFQQKNHNLTLRLSDK